MTVLSRDGGRVCQKKCSHILPPFPSMRACGEVGRFNGEVRKHQRVGLHDWDSGHFKRWQLQCIQTIIWCELKKTKKKKITYLYNLASYAKDEIMKQDR